jgi:hypothetical protein
VQWPAPTARRFERIPVARYQPAGTALEISDRSKPIQFRLEDKVRMLERRIDAGQRHRSDAGEGSRNSILAVWKTGCSRRQHNILNRGCPSWLAKHHVCGAGLRFFWREPAPVSSTDPVSIYPAILVRIAVRSTAEHGRWPALTVAIASAAFGLFAAHNRHRISTR